MKHLCIVLILFVAAVSFGQVKDNSKNNGRYQLVQLGQFRRDQFLLDTQTGTLWSKVCVKLGKDGICDGLSYWQREPVEGINITLKEINSLVEKPSEK